MNTRSIRFRLTVWYAGLLTALLALFGVFIYFTLERFLERSLTETLVKDARTIGQSWLFDVNQSGPGYVAAEIEEHIAPSVTGRFVRITRALDGKILYRSLAPESGAFDPSHVGPTQFAASQSSREEHPPDGKELLIFTMPFTDRAGNQYLIETGARDDQVEYVLRGLLISLGVAFPLIVGAAIGGGYLLMRNALRPMDEIATTAERITSRNLNERLPVVPTGDEIERLSASLNRMMERLEEAFHHISRFSADAAHEIRTPLGIFSYDSKARSRLTSTVIRCGSNKSSSIWLTMRSSTPRPAAQCQWPPLRRMGGLSWKCRILESAFRKMRQAPSFGSSFRWRKA